MLRYGYVRIEQESLLFECFNGKFIADSPKAIYDLIKTNKSLKIYWVCADKLAAREILGCNERLMFVEYQTLSYYQALAKSKRIISNCRLPYFFVKKKGQKYYQCWHGTPLKKNGA